MKMDADKLLVLGPEGTYLDGLAKSMDIDCPVEYGKDFPTMIRRVEETPETAVLLPIKNTLDGALYSVVGAFQNRALRVIGIAQLNVVSNIMGIGTLEGAKKIGGKDVALGQITDFMPELERVEMTSTAAVGKYIRDTGDTTMLAVGALAQAEAYDLNVLAPSAQDKLGINRTTVLITRGMNGWTFDPESVAHNADRLHGTMIMQVCNSQQPGALYRALGEMVDRDINVTNIESLNIRGTEETEFFITITGTGTAIADLCRSTQAAEHLTLDVLGVYPMPIVYDS